VAIVVLSSLPDVGEVAFLFVQADYCALTLSTVRVSFAHRQSAQRHGDARSAQLGRRHRRTSGMQRFT
jgi:hypothetical protein